MAKTIKIGYGQTLRFAPYQESQFPWTHTAQIQIIDKENHFSGFFDFDTPEQIDEVIDALRELKRSFPNQSPKTYQERTKAPRGDFEQRKMKVQREYADANSSIKVGDIIRAEIERLKNELIQASCKSEYDDGRISAFEDTILFIDSLPNEEVNEKTTFCASERGTIDEIIFALKSLGNEKMISYHKEIEFLQKVRKM